MMYRLIDVNGHVWAETDNNVTAQLLINILVSHYKEQYTAKDFIIEPVSNTPNSIA